MPLLSPVDRSALSLERKLPILIGGLVTCALLATLLLVQYELHRSAVGAAGGRLQLVGAELGKLFDGMIEQRTQQYVDVASEPVLAAFALGQSNDVPGVHSALDRLRQTADRSLPIQLRSTTGRVIAATGDMPAAEASSPPRADRILYSRMTPLDDGFQYWVSAPVRFGGSVVGHITQHRRTYGSTAFARFEQILGTDVELYVANADGGDWAAFGSGTLTGIPRIDDVGQPFTYRRADDTQFFAYAARIAGTPWLLVVQMPMAAVTGPLDQVLRRIALIGLLLLLIGMLPAWIISRRVTRPLGELGSVADAIAAGDYSQRAHFDRGDEIGRLARSFDAMAARVDGTHAELQRRFREAQSLAAELELANARLHAAIRDAESARRDAQQASSAKSEFLATMSHEIRTPINAIIGYTDLMDLRLSGPLTEEQHNYVQRIRLSSEHLISVVNDVLDFAKIESGQMRIAREVIPARPCIDDAVSIIQARAHAKHISITINSPISAVFMGDTQRVQQVLLNLLSNALKFTPEGGSITVRCEHRESRGFGEHADASLVAWTCISVCDDGIGIGADLIGPIFEPFVQGAGGYTRPHGGTGLGLAISRSLARMMEGDLTVESAPGVGSTFTLWLPHPSTAAVPV